MIAPDGRVGKRQTTNRAQRPPLQRGTERTRVRHNDGLPSQIR